MPEARGSANEVSEWATGHTYCTVALDGRRFLPTSVRGMTRGASPGARRRSYSRGSEVKTVDTEIYNHQLPSCECEQRGGTGKTLLTLLLARRLSRSVGPHSSACASFTAGCQSRRRRRRNPSPRHTSLLPGQCQALSRSIRAFVVRLLTSYLALGAASI